MKPGPICAGPVRCAFAPVRTGAIVDPYVVDATKCLSYVTIEYRGDRRSLDRDLQTRMGNRIFGCDDCLDVCPYNAFAPATDEPAVHPTAADAGPEFVPALGIERGGIFPDLCPLPYPAREVFRVPAQRRHRPGE